VTPSYKVSFADLEEIERHERRSIIIVQFKQDHAAKLSLLANKVQSFRDADLALTQ
jgi:hypothetical protein